MEAIVSRLVHDDPFLDLLLQTSYWTWQRKYLTVLVKCANIIIPTPKGWTFRDVILLYQHTLPKANLVAVLMKHCSDSHDGSLRFVLNEADIYKVGRILAAPEGDFVADLLAAIGSIDVAYQRFRHLMKFLDPASQVYQPLSRSSSDNVAITINFDPKPFIPLLMGAYGFFNNEIRSSREPLTISEVID